jgi:hypothetical protein
MKAALIGFLTIGFLASACSSAGTDPNLDEPTKSATQAVTDAWFAQRDTKLCSLPSCDGYWLVDGEALNACGKIAYQQYVTGIYRIGPNPQGSNGLVPVSPTCNERLSGALQPDPKNSGYQILVIQSP